MKHPSVIRDQLLNLIAGPKGALEHLRIRLSMYAADELEVLRQLERPQAFDLGVDIVNVIMERLEKGAAPAREGYFDKTRRAANKKNPRRGRGVLKPEDRALLEGAAKEST